MSVSIVQTVKREPIISSAVLGMFIFILTEVMVFASFISAFNIIKSSFTNWPPLGQPRLPLEITAVNSLFLLASAWWLHQSQSYFKKEQGSARVRKYCLTALLLGVLFVMIQGVEWIRLMRYGLTLTSSIYGSFFYLIIGTHALHVLFAILALFISYRKLLKNELKQDTFAAMKAFWFFVVGLWPVLYWLVYL